jgi:hypothetical protein
LLSAFPEGVREKDKDGNLPLNYGQLETLPAILKLVERAFVLRKRRVGTCHVHVCGEPGAGKSVLTH